MRENFEWMQPISKEIFQKKYMINEEKTEDEVFRGIAEEIASAEKRKVRSKWGSRFYDEMSEGRLIPAGRILANARPNARMPFYNNCYTIAVEDSIESIYNSLQEDALISRTGGGVGLNFSNLRPKDAGLSTGGQSSGVLSFMKVFNESAKVIQTGGSRRAAHIGILNVDHPEIEDFILSKRGDKNKVLTQFNISVGITDKFMDAVKDDLDWDLVFDGEVYKTVKATYLYELMTMNAFTHNEPGILNLDTVNRMNNGAYGFQIFEVNPCGEIVMPPYSLCCLSALNLTKFVYSPFTEDAWFDFEEFSASVAIGIRFLDNVLDATQYPLQKIEDMSKKWRRIGLGFTGLGNVFSMMGMVYGDDESKKLSEMIGEHMRDKSYETSIGLAKEKGSFPSCINKKLVQSPFIKELPDVLQRDIRKYGLRNVAMNTVAPTGTTSLSLGQNCSSGIEPCFSLSYTRNIRTGFGDETKPEKVHDYAWLKYQEYAGSTGVETDGDGNYPVPDSFKTTFDIDVYKAMDIQVIFQKYIDHSISKTLNLPMGTTYEEYKDLFQYAYDNGLKGFTSFNPEGSMKGILETTAKAVDKNRETPKRPKELPCNIHELTYKGDKYILLVGMYENLPYEIFVTQNVDKEFNFKKNKTGKICKCGKGKYSLIIENGEEKVYIEDIINSFDPVYGTLGRFISMGLRHKVSLQFIVEQLNKDSNFAGFERTVSRVLKTYIEEGEEVKSSHSCIECGSEKLVYKEGCLTCPDCGWSKCS